MPPIVNFIVLNEANKHRIVCEIVEKLYTAGKRTIVHVTEESEGQKLDQMMWSWKQNSFVPHLYCNEVNQEFTEPVIIAKSIIKTDRFDSLLLVQPADIKIIQTFDTVFDFAEKYDLALVKKSRERYKLYQQENFKLNTYQPGEYLHAE